MRRTGKYYKLTIMGLVCVILGIILLVAFTGAVIQSVIGVIAGLAALSLGSGIGKLHNGLPMS